MLRKLACWKPYRKLDEAGTENIPLHKLVHNSGRHGADGSRLDGNSFHLDFSHGGSSFRRDQASLDSYALMTKTVSRNSKSNSYEAPMDSVIENVRNSRAIVFEDELPALNREFQIRSRADLKQRLHSPSLTPRLTSQNSAEKFDVSVMCPDGQTFKASVFRSWTAFQLLWKIAHVKGMVEKLALVLREEIGDLHLVRDLEDHEIVYSVVSKWAPDSRNRLFMIEDATKYDIFTEPAECLPVEMLDVCPSPKLSGVAGSRSRRSSLLQSIMNGEKFPDLQGFVLHKDFDKKRWMRTYMRIDDGAVYIGQDDQCQDIGQMKCLCKTEDAYMYCGNGSEFQTAHGSPTPYCFCVIPKIVSHWHEIKCFCAENQRMLTGWFTGFRLAKYGQQLHVNYREVMSKEANLRRTNSSRQSVLFRRSADESEMSEDPKAALDFSGVSSRIISDPAEAAQVQHEMAFEIPKTLKRRSGSFAPAIVKKNVLDDKQWYHGKLDREQSVARLKRAGMKEGLFLVRESSSSIGNLVLTVISRKGKIAHHQIFQSSSHSGLPLYGIEHGPQFSSLELLIESYHSGAVEGADFCLKKPCPVK